MLTKYVIHSCFLFLLLNMLPSCENFRKNDKVFTKKSSDSKTVTASGYDLKKPLIIRLSDELAEISGIAFYAKDTSVFAISDENGYLFKIHLTTKNPLIKKWKFSKTHDFEDVVLHDSTFFILESNGNIFKVNFSPDGDSLNKSKASFDQSKKNEFESLYYDEELQQLVLVCKQCKDDGNSTVTAWGYDPTSETYSSSVYQIDVSEIEKLSKGKEKKMKFRPSAATINPETKDIWILSSINKMIVVIDKKGIVKEIFPLDDSIMLQPEGITFTPWGDLIISSEAGDKYGKGSLFIFKKLTKQK